MAKVYQGMRKHRTAAGCGGPIRSLYRRGPASNKRQMVKVARACLSCRKVWWDEDKGAA